MAKKTKEKPEVCPECGGAKRGKGYAHAAGCSMASRSSGRAAGGIDGRSLRAMDVSELLNLRERVNEALEAKAPDIDAEIERLKALKASLKK